MDNYLFRNALNGFNRQDVTTYIEKAQKDAAERATQLEKELEELHRELDDREQSLRREIEDTEQSLQCSVKERESLMAQLEEQKVLFERSQSSCQLLTTEKEHCEELLAQREETLRQRDEELRRLRSDHAALVTRATEMEAKIETARREKESVAQIEVEALLRAEGIESAAKHRAEETLAQARTQAQTLVNDANAQAQRTVEEARTRAEELLTEMETKIEQTTTEYNALFSSFETVSTHISTELRKMDVTVSQLPINFNHLKEGLAAVLEQAKERGSETEESAQTAQA